MNGFTKHIELHSQTNGDRMSDTVEVLPALTPEQEARSALGRAMEVLTMAKAVKIIDEDSYASADAAVASIKSAQKQAEAKRTELVKPLNDTVKKINAAFKPVDAAFEEALAHYRRPMSLYQADLAEKRRKAEEDARLERERIEREERAKVEAARKAEEEARLAAEAAAATDDPFAAILAEDAAKTAAEAAAQTAEAAKQAIREVVTMPVTMPAKVTGSASKTFTVYGYEIEDESLIPRPYWILDHAALLRDVRASKDECRIPGLKITKSIEVK